MKPNKLSDCYQTPQDLMDTLDKEFSFVIDACATEDNVEVRNGTYLTDATKDWKEQYLEMVGQYPEDSECSVSMNPPYSNPRPFLERAWEFSKHMRVVGLVRDDPSTKWYKNLSQDNVIVGTYYPVSLDNIDLIIKDMYISQEELAIIRLPERLRFGASEEMMRYDYDPLGVEKIPFYVREVLIETKNFRRTEDGKIECKHAYNFPCCLMIMNRG